jgi:serine/threonine protein kinase
MNDPTPGSTPLATEFQPAPDTRDGQVHSTAPQPASGVTPALPVAAHLPAQTSYRFLGPPDRPDDLGRLGPYRVTWLLGEGGMGFVFEGEDEQLRRPIALKVMRPEIAAAPVARERFLREGRAVAAVNNDHVVTIYQVGEANGVPFLAMERLEGCTLEEWLRRQPGPVTPKAVAKVARNVLRGLAAAHAKGIVHRDIKPNNLWVEKATSRVKLFDFGITRVQDEDVGLTGRGQPIGTPAYMSPEQANGAEVDARSDLFSLGVVVHRMLTGRSPFERENVMATLSALATVTLPPTRTLAPDLPGPLADLIDRLLARDPAGRPADAGAALAEWQAAEKRSGPGTTALPPPPRQSLPYAVPVEPKARPADTGPWHADGKPPEAAPTAGGGTPADTGLDLEPLEPEILPDNPEAENLLDGVHGYVKRDTASDRQMRREWGRRPSRPSDRGRDDRDDDRDRGREAGKRSRREREPAPPALPARDRSSEDPQGGPPPLRRRKRRGFPVLIVVGAGVLVVVLGLAAAGYVVLFGSGSTSRSGDSAATAGWTFYSSPDGLFSAKFPTTPLPEKGARATAYKSQTLQMVLAVLVKDANSKSLSEVASQETEELSSVLDRRDVMSGGIPGKQFTIDGVTIKDLDIKAKKVMVRIFVYKDKNIMMVAAEGYGALQEDQVTAFFNSLTLR